MIYQMHKHHGRHIAYTPQEAQTNHQFGWYDVSEEEFYREHKTKKTENPLRKQYEEKFGKPPHPRMKDETIQAALDADRTGSD